MTIADVLMIIAVILGPILAVQAQKMIEAWRNKREKRITVFRVLMATRGTPISPHHVEALNLIDIEFAGESKKEKSVREAWKLYLDYLSECPNDFQDPSYQAKLSTWSSKSRDCHIDLLYAMSQALGYNFDKVLLKKGAYTPKGFADLEFEQSLLRRGVLDVLYGKRGIPMIPFVNPDKTTPEKSENQIGNNKT